MIALVRAEWTKLFTTRVWLGLFLGACVLVGGFSALFVGLAGVTQDGRPGLPSVGTSEFEKLAFATPSNAVVLMLILGIIGMTQEYRHRTVTATFLTTPRRARVVIAKLVAYGLAAVPFALVIVAVNVVVVTVYAGARGATPSFTGDNIRVMATAGLALVIYTVIGVGVGALVRNQVGAIVGALVYLFVIEGLIASFSVLAQVHKWLPGGALQALTESGQGADVLNSWQGGLLLLGYGLLAALLGTLLAVRRDVT
jgi:ABC-type transport system involved in multi-copper enzyme maturation permease subunit